MARKGRSPWTWVGVVLLIVIIVGAGVLVFKYLTPTGAQVKQPFSITDKLAHTAWSPAGASVLIYDPHGLTSMPSGDVAAFTFIGAASESPDGTFTLTQTLPVDYPIYVYATDSALVYWNMGVFCKVQPEMSGTTGYAQTISIAMLPNDYTNDGVGECSETGHYYKATQSMLLICAGSAKTNSTNVPTGDYSYDLQISVLSGYDFGGSPYIAPLTGYYYTGGFIVLRLLTTTARGTVSASNMWASYGGIGSGLYWYWVIGFDQISNDASITTDGTGHVFFQMNNQVASTDCFAVQIYPGARPADIASAAFGNNQENDNLRLIHFA